MLLTGMLILGVPGVAAAADRYEGKYCAGAGDVEFLRLIDESLAFFHPNPIVPSVAMIYQPDWNTFIEGAGWGAWWIQNSYGFAYAAAPLLQDPWFSTLQHSLDLFWDNQGDGKRMGRCGDPKQLLYQLVAPDGCLGDCASPGEIVYKQGDGNPAIHDWFHEATAAGVVMEAEILLCSRNPKAIAKYLPKMERACDSIERTRDPKNSLFLVGPGCNLLAPSYGGVKQPDGTFGKGYLAGLSINYLAALDRMVELYKLTGDKQKLADYQRRQRITRESLPQLLTPAGYFVKSIEPGGTKHGVLGQKRFGYLEGVANADAVALRVVDDAVARSIYKQIEASPAIRPFDFLLTNAPSLDDTYVGWGSREPGGIFEFGCWVNGGVWGTVEGRAVLMYYRLGKFEDVRRSLARVMKWARDFRMDDHFTQRGENTDNLWYDKGPDKWGNVTLAVDNYAIPAAAVRGLFDYEYRADRLILRPRVPGTITQYVQKHPVRFGEKTLYVSCRNGGPRIRSATVSGKAIRVDSPEALALVYDELPKEARVEIVTEGGWSAGSPARPAVGSTEPPFAPLFPAGGKTIALSESLKRPYAVLVVFERRLAQEAGAECERAFTSEAIAAIEAWRQRTAVDPGSGYFRPMTPKKRESILKAYEDAALGMYNGLAKQMTGYATGQQAEKKRLADLFSSLQKDAETRK
jgi:hypothetical protein